MNRRRPSGGFLWILIAAMLWAAIVIPSPSERRHEESLDRMIQQNEEALKWHKRMHEQFLQTQEGGER